MARIDRSKRAMGTAVRRSEPSRAAALLVERGLAVGRVLDYGCGFGFEIYAMSRQSRVIDETRDFTSRRDRAKAP